MHYLSFWFAANFINIFHNVTYRCCHDILEFVAVVFLQYKPALLTLLIPSIWWSLITHHTLHCLHLISKDKKNFSYKCTAVRPLKNTIQWLSIVLIYKRPQRDRRPWRWDSLGKGPSRVFLITPPSMLHSALMIVPCQGVLGDMDCFLAMHTWRLKPTWVDLGSKGTLKTTSSRNSKRDPT